MSATCWHDSRIGKPCESAISVHTQICELQARVSSLERMNLGLENEVRGLRFEVNRLRGERDGLTDPRPPGGCTL